MVTTLVRYDAEPIEVRVAARQSGVPPALVRRFVAWGLLDDGPADDAACELLARIDELERRLSRYEAR
jgi:hypothetical protein